MMVIALFIVAIGLEVSAIALAGWVAWAAWREIAAMWAETKGRAGMQGWVFYPMIVLAFGAAGMGIVAAISLVVFLVVSVTTSK